MNGQASGHFREWTVPRRTLTADSLDQDWSRRCPYPHIVLRGARGPRSLVDMATNAVADNIGQITERHAEAMPPRVQWRVWRFLEARYVRPRGRPDPSHHVG